MRVIITTRTTFTRFERLQTLSGPGAMVEVQDFEDRDEEAEVPEGVDLKTFAHDLARIDPTVVAVRPADPRA